MVSKDPPARQSDASQATGDELDTEKKSEPAGGASAEHPGSSAPRGGSTSDTEIEARLARLEKTLAVVLTLLRRLVRAVEPLEKRPEQVRS